MKRDNSSAQPTIEDVARLAQVSVGTVSHVISKSRYVRPETQERVEKAIARLGFRPNRVARALISQRTSTIGMILPDISNPYFSELLRGAEDVLYEADYAAFFGNSDNDPDKEQLYIRAFRDRMVDGVIAVIATDADAAEIRALGEEIPMVIMDRLIPEWAGDSVSGDDHVGMEMAVNHLVQLGHTRIALINGTLSISSTSRRRQGFEDSLRAHGVAPVAVSEGRFTIESGYAQASAILEGDERPTAIVAGNDLLAIGALSAARDAGLHVPGDLSLTGYDDISYAQISSPGLTTIRQPAREMGAVAARLILERLTSKGSGGQQLLLQPELIVRRSTAPPRPSDAGSGVNRPGG